MKKSRNTLLILLTYLFASIGAVLYFGNYFIGLLFILFGVLIYSYFFYKSKGLQALFLFLKAKLLSLRFAFFGIIFALIIGGIIMALAGYNPFIAYKALFYGGFYKNWSISVLNAIPLIFTGLSIAFAFHAGLFNIGAEGQYYIGAMSAAFFGIYVSLPTLISIPLILVLSCLFAALYNYLPALLKVKTGAHEVITTMMLAHVARYFSPIFIRAFGGNPSNSLHPYVTDKILESAMLTKFSQFLPNSYYRLHIGILIAVAAALLIYFILYNTTLGFEIRAVGYNKKTAQVKGINSSRIIIVALLISGALAGLSGSIQIIGLEHRMMQDLNVGYGWNGISVALFAANNPIAVIFTALLWGALDSGGQYMARTVQIPSSISEIIKGIILFLVVARYIYVYFGHKFIKNKKAAPRQISES